jgi:hypothetical protein
MAAEQGSGQAGQRVLMPPGILWESLYEWMKVESVEIIEM